MTEISYQTPGVRGFRDWGAMLLVVGILFIVAGAVCGCLTAATPVAMFAPMPAGAPRQRVADIVAAAAIYGVLCAALLMLGIGCVRRRRWVRPFIIVFGWIGLVGGAIAMVMWLIALPQMGNAMRAAAATPAGTPAPPPAFFNVMIAVMTVFFVAIYLVVPATLLWLFRSEDVRATLEYYDPSPRWTDSVPIPVLGLCVLLALGTLWALMATSQGWFFLFGLLLSGAAARLVGVALAMTFAAAAWLAFRRRPAGWWLALALFTVLPLGWVATLLRHDVGDIYRAMGMDDTQLRVIGSMPMLTPTIMGASILFMAIAAVSFTVRVRPLFPGAPSMPPPATPSQPPPAHAPDPPT